MEPEMNAFSICKGLLARLNLRNKSPKKTFPCTELVPYSAKWVCSYRSKCEIKAPTKYIVTIPVAYIIVPLFDTNDDSVTLELKPGGKKSKQVTCHFAVRIMSKYQKNADTTQLIVPFIVIGTF
jgi:hypothetical protein